MQYSEGQVGRVFALRLEHGEPMPESLEAFAAEREVYSGLVIMVGGVDDGSRLVVGPEDGAALPAVPMVTALSGVHEVAAVGTLFPAASEAPGRPGRPVLHMHAACGRQADTTTGCIREGISTWQTLEILLIEISGLDAARVSDPATGFQLLQCRGGEGTAQPSP
jgi:predicted DNA-binding protein with PD1-like motif